VVTNTGATALTGWTVRWTFTNGQTITQLWNGTYTQSGANVTVTNMSYNGTLAPGQSATVGFLANVGATNNPPSVVSCG
jgi:cellulase/cellobiase CelA1